MITNSMSSLGRTICLSLVLACLATAAGCSDFGFDKKKIPWFGEKDDEPGTPTRVVAIWKDAVLHRPNETSMRGFGGRLMFYDGRSEDPIKVDGDVVVYAFDEDGRRRSDAKPDRKYVFTREQLGEHYSKSDIGHSYSLWVPWDEAGGPQKKISLIARFKPVGGSTVISEQASSMLPGVTPLVDFDSSRPNVPADSRTNVSGEVRPVGYDAVISDPGQASDETSTEKRMNTHTIELPPRFGRATPSAAMLHADPTPTRGSTVRRTTTVLPASSPSSPAQTDRPSAEPAPQASTSRSARFAPAISRAPAAPIARPALDRRPSPLLPAK
jgi:hypothetical protein